MKVYQKMAIRHLREWAEEKGLTFVYHPLQGATFYKDGVEVGWAEDKREMAKFIDTWPY